MMFMNRREMEDDAAWMGVKFRWKVSEQNHFWKRADGTSRKATTQPPAAVHPISPGGFMRGYPAQAPRADSRSTAAPTTLPPTTKHPNHTHDHTPVPSLGLGRSVPAEKHFETHYG